jgi:hypothetical protein
MSHFYRPRTGSAGVRAILGLLGLIALANPSPAGAGSPRAPEAPLPPAVAAEEAKAWLIAAYPAHLDRFEGDTLLWRDGTRMPFDDGRGAKTPAQRIASSDLEDMFAQCYVRGAMAGVPPADFDPGRARNEALFDKMYGRCAEGGVERHLASVIWLPTKWGKPLKLSRVNGAAERLAQVSRELDKLDKSFDPFLFPPAGTYNCRRIAGTERGSPHGWGIAIDLATARANYWRWEKPSEPGHQTYRNSFPLEIVEVFERHGFIWGGKWCHFDTMHFEYRPELLGLAGSR